MSEHKANGEKAVGAWVFRSFNMLLNLGALMIMAYFGLWIKNNVPSRGDFIEMRANFKELQDKLNSVDRSVLQLGETGKRIDDFEQRIRVLEKATTGRSRL